MNAVTIVAAHQRAALIVLLCLLLGACATTPPPKTINPDTPASTPAAQTTANPLAINDPWEGFNKRVYRFNALADHYVLLPVVHAYKKVTPDFVRTGVAHFFSNLGEINTLANSILQLKPESSGVTLARFVTNSTIGIGGLFDPATRLGLAQRHEDLGQTLGHYGVGTGPYLVLPFFGPSDMRATVVLVGDHALFYVIDPLQINGDTPAQAAYDAMYIINTRNTTHFRYYQTGSTFEYSLVRFVYLNYRALQVQQ